MIQDIGAHCYDNAYHNVQPRPEDYVVYCETHTELICKRMEKDGKESFEFPRFCQVADANPGIYEKCTYLFKIDDQRFFLAEQLVVPEHLHAVMENTQYFRGGEPRHLAFAGITAYQLYRWYGSRRFCGRCGSPMKKDQRERMMYCEHCHQTEYPKICPGVIVGVRDGNRLLMTKYAGRPYTKYALIAGFTEIGETLEETVRREVMEEVGLKVKNIQYYKNQPWSYSDSLLVGFFCDLDREGPTEIQLERNELSQARWFEREDIPLEDFTHVALTHEMIRYFKYGFYSPEQ